MSVNEHGAAMFADDEGSPTLGVELLEVSDGRAVTRLTVGPEMLNGLGLCHGGFIFAVGDTALAFAANSRGEGAPTRSAAISYRRPARPGAVLTAIAEVTDRGEKSLGVEVEVTDQHGELIASLRGESRLPR